MLDWRVIRVGREAQPHHGGYPGTRRETGWQSREAEALMPTLT